MTGVPNNIVIPWVGVDFDNSRAQPAVTPFPVNLLLIAQRLATGTVEAEIPYIATTADQVAQKSGFGSMAHMAMKKIEANNTTVTTTIITLDDAATSTAATREFTVSGTATENGEVSVYVAGQRYAVAVADGDDATTVATAIVAALTTDVDQLPCTAANVLGVVTLTLKNKGVAAGDLDVRFNYNRGEQFPAGISIGSITETAGTVDPDISDALAVFGDNWYNVIAQPFTDNTNLNLLEDFLDTQNGSMVQKDSQSYQAKRDTRANMITFGEDTERNSQFLSTLPAYKRMETTLQVAAGVAAAIAVSIQDDTAVPLHRIRLKGFSAQNELDRWGPVERNQLALASISTLSDDNGVQTEACFTMYRKNSAGAADTSYRKQNTMYQLSEARYSFVQRILSKYPRAKQAKTSEGIGDNQQILTEDIAKSEAILWFKEYQTEGLFEPGREVLDQFKAELQVQRSTSSGDRMEWLLPPDLMNQFIVGSGTIQFLE